MKLFDLSLKLNGYPLEKAKKEYEKILSIPEDQYETYIETKKWEIVRHHFDTNPFYRKLLNGKLPEKWEDIPVLTKRNLQIPLEERLAEGYHSKNIFKNKTSGSTGTPMIFAKDRFFHALVWANTIDLFGRYNIDFNSSYQARFYGIPINRFAAFKERIKDILANRYRFSVYDISDAAMQTILNKFQKKKFDYINGYTTAIVAFGKYLDQKGIVLKEICPTLKVCIVTAEMLFDVDREMLSRTLGVPIVNEYGASEISLIAFEDKSKNWKINWPLVFVEIVDEDFKNVEFGTSGRVLITSFYNKAHPFIRYDIGDIGTIEKSKNETILKDLIGRSDDIVVLPSGKEILGWTFSYITKNLIDQNGNVKEFLAQQVSKSDFIIEYVSNEELTADQLKKIQIGIDEFLEPGLNFKFLKKDKLKRTKSGKLKQFESLI